MKKFFYYPRNSRGYYCPLCPPETSTVKNRRSLRRHFFYSDTHSTHDLIVNGIDPEPEFLDDYEMLQACLRERRKFLP
jgi:hypothetical protein